MTDFAANREALERAAFLDERKSGIGSSDAPAIMGVDRWTTPQQVWAEKLGVADEEPVNEDMLRGRDFEDIAAKRYARATGRRIRRKGLVRAPAPNGHAIAHIDRHIIAEAEDLTPGVLEVKCPRFHKWLSLDREGANLAMVYQVQHQLGCTGWGWARFAIYHPELGLRTFEMEAVPEIIEQLMAATRAFWEDYVITKEPPPEPTPVEIELPEGLQGLEGSIVQLTPQNDAAGATAWSRLSEEYRVAEELEKEARALLEQRKNAITDLMESVEADAVEGGDLRAYWRWQDGRTTTDKPRLRAAGLLEPEAVQTAIFEMADEGLIDRERAAAVILRLKEKECGADVDSYTKQGKPFRTFRRYWLKEGQ